MTRGDSTIGPGWRLRMLGGLAALSAAFAGGSLPGAARALEEPPILEVAVKTRELPPMAERLPAAPRRDLPRREDWREGRYGGTLRVLLRGGRDPRELALLGYARLVVWNEDYRLIPDILASVEIVEGRRFTLHLREGHRWSDGHPFTAEDFRFWWQDVANNDSLSPTGPPREMLADGVPPRFEVLDARTLSYSWEAPNPNFLPALAAASPLYIYRPAHVLKRSHAAYADKAALDAEAEDFGLEDWAALYHRRDRMFLSDNPDLPSLEPWVNTTRPPADRFVALRNPYFHRVDGAGRQLPYIDRIFLDRGQASLIPIKAAAGESDLQAKGLAFPDYTALKESEKRQPIEVRLWAIGRGSQLALYPNLNTVLPVWRKLLRDVRFRRALSLAIDREEINKVIYQGLALSGGNGLLPGSPLYRAEDRAAWAGFDLARANALLDEIGLTARDDEGLRLLPDGRPLRIVVETAEVDPSETEVLQLIAETWLRAGIDLVIRATGRQAARQRIRSGTAVMSLFYGLANGLARPDMSPAELAPTSDAQNNWPLWGLHYQTAGRAGEAPDLPEAAQLLSLYEAWTWAEDREERERAWRAMLALHADQVFTIGIIGQAGQPVVARKSLRNLPETAPYLYEPGAYFGLYRPDTFWIDEGG